MGLVSQKMNEQMSTSQPPSHAILRINAKMMDVRFKCSPKRRLRPGLQVILGVPPGLNESAMASLGTSWAIGESHPSKRGWPVPSSCCKCQYSFLPGSLLTPPNFNSTYCL